MPKVALVHDWLTGMRGGEYVLEAIGELFPEAEIFTLLHVPGSVSESLTRGRKIHTSWLQKVPGASRRYRHFLPLMPSMIESFDLTGFDLVISSSHCVAKGIRRPPGAVHVSYVHAPMRYIWDRFDDYFGPGRASPWVRAAAWAVRPSLQAWDKRVSGPGNVDLLVANSRFIASQIRAAYGRDAEVVHPFADLARFTQTRKPGEKYLMVGAFAPNKRVDLAIQAFNRLKLPLQIVGGGQEEGRLRAIAGPTIEFFGALPNEAIADLFARCRAFVFPGLEDFGITPVEALAAGAPVIAYGAGGALETVDSQTGIFFTPQTAEAFIRSVQDFESRRTAFSPEASRARAQEFSKQRFQREISGLVRGIWEKSGRSARLPIQ